MRFRVLFTLLILVVGYYTYADTLTSERRKAKNQTEKDSIGEGIRFLNSILSNPEVWEFQDKKLNKNLKGLVHFIEDEKIDTILLKLNSYDINDSLGYVRRYPWNVTETMGIGGYLTAEEVREKLLQLDRNIRDQVDLESIPIPESLLTGLESLINTIQKGDTIAILKRTGIILPDSLMNISMQFGGRTKPNQQEIENFRKHQEVRNELLEDARVMYNNKLLRACIDSVSFAYRNSILDAYSDSLQNQLKDSLMFLNDQKLVAYNDSVVKMVNDSINYYLNILKKYALKDSTGIWIHNTSGDSMLVWTGNQQKSISRMYIKNEQNDSLGVRLLNIDRNALKIAIDDGVLISRIQAKKQRDIRFECFTLDKGLHKINQRYKVTTPWKYGGNGNFGFTQTHLSNWNKGGESALSFLMVMKGYANYSQNKIKWENSTEIRNGWIRQGGDIKETRKNDDKFEIISRFGLSAFKKWYYSAEVDYQTQFFNGFEYGDETKTKVSSIMSPAKTLIKFGLDYKPNNSFSLFISPLTSKTVSVKDTAKIDQTRYGIDSDKKRYWEPGLNADLKYKMNITSDISLETKYKMFVNYTDFSRFDIDWESLIEAQLTDRINVSLNIHFIYDSNITNPKLQTKELMTVGFNYKLDRRIYRRLKIDD